MTYLTDFAVHPLWVHPSVDVHLATSERAAETARIRGGEDARAPGPLVADRFRPVPVAGRSSARAALGIRDSERAVLVVAGSWGVGDVAGTYRAILAAGEFHPVVVCGRDDRLRTSLESIGKGTILGWTDTMPDLMAACDVMVENAGGLTANEAFAVGLPVVSFLPIAGHGRDNAVGMSELGITRYARTPEELRTALTELSRVGAERQEQIARAHQLFVGDPAVEVLTEAERRGEKADSPPVEMPKLPHRVRVMAVSSLAIYVLLTLGAQGVAALGVGVADAPRAVEHRVYLGVRLTAAEIQRPGIRAALDRLNATAIIDGQTAQDAGPQPLQALTARDVDLGNGGWGDGRPFRYLRAETDVVHAADVLTKMAGAPVTEFVPERRFDAFDQLFARGRGQRLVRADQVIRPEALPAHLNDRGIYVLDGRRRDPAAVEAALADLEDSLVAEGLTSAPLSELR